MDVEELRSTVNNNLAGLSEIVNTKYDDKDDRTKADIWNEYQEALDTISNTIKVNSMPGVRLDKNVKTNIPTSAGQFIGLMLVGAIISVLNFVIANASSGITPTMFTDYESPFWVGFYILTPTFCLGVVGFIWCVHRASQPKIKLSCKPILHIDELAYATTILKEFPQMKKDPDVNLPELHVEISRQWLAQESSLNVTKDLSHLKLGLNKEDSK